MKRSDFLKSGLVAGAALASGSTAFADNNSSAQNPGKTFNLNYAPHDGMFKNHAGGNFLDQIKFMHDQGFRGIEDNGMLGRSKEEQDKIGDLLAKLGMTMGVFVIDGGDNWKTSLTTGKKDFLDKFLDTCRRSAELAKRVNAKWATVVPGFYALKRGSEILEKTGLVMVLEPLSDTPDLFLRYSDQTYAICRAVGSPSCKILFDMYHMQRNEGNIIKNMDLCWDEIAYLQIGDNPGRNEPTSGEMNYKNIFKHVYAKGFRGIMGMEHGNAKPGKEGEMALIKAYRDTDSFL
jgi:hydroxypyruvate isomerase